MSLEFRAEKPNFGEPIYGQENEKGIRTTALHRILKLKISVETSHTILHILNEIQLSVWRG